MKYRYFIFLLILCAFLIDDTLAEKPRKHKKVRRPMKKPVDADVAEMLGTNDQDQDDVVKMLDKDEEYEKTMELLRENERATRVLFNEDSQQQDNQIAAATNMDLCAKVHCGAGRVCEVDAVSGEPSCVCIESCPVETEVRRKVCSNHNETWPSDCAVYQQRCWCDKGDQRCRGEDYKHVHIEYYGECRDMPECTDGEMADFPRRMRDWLFNIMRDLADRQELPAYYLKMEREAETNMTKRWTNAAVWKWCDLDGHPQDRSVSRHELFPIRAPLMALEHCIAPFLNNCDTDDNHRITLKEWAECLEIDQEEINDKCDEIE